MYLQNSSELEDIDNFLRTMRQQLLKLKDMFGLWLYPPPPPHPPQLLIKQLQQHPLFQVSLHRDLTLSGSPSPPIFALETYTGLRKAPSFSLQGPDGCGSSSIDKIFISCASDWCINYSAVKTSVG